MSPRPAGPPGLRLHSRTMRVQSAAAQLHMDLINFQADLELTDLEMLIALGTWHDHHLKMMLRAERHPEDPDRKADEE